ncbi:uncharacterized protein LOC110030814 [Phalaenopsis equestris]|uniref:uncharacterized protein LOC110030814 n=1 Tax=Phalaenopsis equestris TaxID=78828 RepID=UPI0009E2AB12|nr:uncharacterized protein LOC110030814 [Phalaenopsis equestris]
MKFATYEKHTARRNSYRPPTQEGTIPLSGRDGELLVTTSSTHPSHAGPLAPIRLATVPDDVIWGTVNTFNELARLFAEQFIANRWIIKNSSHLSGIRQSEGESLKDYFRSFSAEARQILGVGPELLWGFFLRGSPRTLLFITVRETVHSYAELVHRVEAQITADEAISAHKEQVEKFGEKRKGNSKNKNQSSQWRKSEQPKNCDLLIQLAGQRTEYQPKKEYTPLNTSHANILMAIKDEQAIKWPNPLKPNTGNQEQYCHFHRSRGHTTEACKLLREEIERLIQQGYLGRFIENKLAGNDNVAIGGNNYKDNNMGVTQS